MNRTATGAADLLSVTYLATKPASATAVEQLGATIRPSTSHGTDFTSRNFPPMGRNPLPVR